MTQGLFQFDKFFLAMLMPHSSGLNQERIRTVRIDLYLPSRNTSQAEKQPVQMPELGWHRLPRNGSGLTTSSASPAPICTVLTTVCRWRESWRVGGRKGQERQGGHRAIRELLDRASDGREAGPSFTRHQSSWLEGHTLSTAPLSCFDLCSIPYKTDQHSGVCCTVIGRPLTPSEPEPLLTNTKQYVSGPTLHASC